MWIALIAVIAVLLTYWQWSASRARDKFMCPVCGHSVSDHGRGGFGELFGSRSHCRKCDKECV
jgi:hypothetical protein